ncbi:MAG TPA: AraC family transcriptional regulator [Povalibacter sp.]|jgi:AraC-like DNA-binding protein|nr:AraC family transcriptional regulator [Povalibacter sp.]
MDVLSNVLSVTSLATSTLGSREFLAPWAIAIDAPRESAVHIVRRGSAWLHHGDHEPIRLNTGDIVLLAGGRPHVLSSDRDARDPEPIAQAIARSYNNVVPSLRGRADTNSEATWLQCAGYEFANDGFSPDGVHPLLSLLPPAIVIPAQRVEADSELQLLLQLIGREAQHREAGAELVLPRLIDTLFVYIVRAWLRDQPDGSAGWLGALRDPQIRKALTLIHESPQAPWTVESLARQAAMSRAAFAKRFMDLVGQPPLAYVTRWRMDLAAKLLRESREPVARIASRVGYLSETAFAKAFRRRRQMPPGAYRFQRTRRAAAAVERSAATANGQSAS